MLQHSENCELHGVINVILVQHMKPLIQPQSYSIAVFIFELHSQRQFQCKSTSSSFSKKSFVIGQPSDDLSQFMLYVLDGVETLLSSQTCCGFVLGKMGLVSRFVICQCKGFKYITVMFSEPYVQRLLQAFSNDSCTIVISCNFLLFDSKPR